MYLRNSNIYILNPLDFYPEADAVVVVVVLVSLFSSYPELRLLSSIYFYRYCAIC